MNGDDRPSTEKQTGSAAPAAAAGPSDIAPVFLQAVQHHQAGQLREAERLYREILTREPNHTRSLNFLGLIAHQLGRNDAALELIGKAIALDERMAEAHYNLALVLEAVGRKSDMLAHYERAVELRPDFAAAMMNLGNAYNDLTRLADAVACYERVLAVQPQASAVHYNIANVLAQQGELERAVTHYQKALALDPGLAEAHNNLGNACKELGRTDEARSHFQRAIAIAPDYVAAYDNVARMLVAEGNHTEAFGLLQRALPHGPTTDTKMLIVRCLQNSQPTSDDPDLRALILCALSEAWIGANELAPTVALFLKQAALIRDATERANSAWPRRLALAELLGPAGVAPLGGDQLLLALLQSAPICDIALERLLTGLRFGLLQSLDGVSGRHLEQGDALNFCCALAQQCFINEYVFDLTEDEAEQVARLREAVAADLKSGAAIPAASLITLAAYLPLHTVPGIDSLLEKNWPHAIARVLALQVREPRLERELRASIPVLTDIDDSTSIAVRGQYEENPYPRWVAPPAAGVPINIERDLRNKLPQSRLESLGKNDAIDVLIAGCGTGRHVVEIVQRLVGLRVLAIDLSLTSLAYATRMARGLGLNDVEFAQADILKLGSIGRTFDVIESNGVLHHLADPFAGWRVLVGLLRPGGLMNIGLYSKTARADIATVRNIIAERGFDGSAADIRCCRQDLMNAAEGTPLHNVTDSRDFFTTSACRDLLFHVQEHQLTIPEISKFLAQNDLEFLGFEVDVAVLHRFSLLFPDPKAVTVLERWHEFEQESSASFAGMYQFWVQKKA
jgi:tetratricopeptide (TPR) repeat protein/SAM-dependent methyltransferase